jgi:hypothetical protein
MAKTLRCADMKRRKHLLCSRDETRKIVTPNRPLVVFRDKVGIYQLGRICQRALQESHTIPLR